MDLQNFLLLNVIGVCLALMLVAGRGARGFALLCIATAMASILANYMWPDIAGFISVGLFAGVVAAPFMAMMRYNRLAMRNDWAAAARWAKRLARVAPTPGNRMQARFAAAYADFFVRNDRSGVEAIAQSDKVYGPVAQMVLADADLRFERSHEIARTHPQYLAMRVYALSELGRLDEMVQAYLDTEDKADPFSRARARAWLFAHAGEADALARLQHGTLKHIAPEGHELRAALLAQAKGEHARAREIFTRLAESCASPITRAAARRRLQMTPVSMSADARAKVAQLAANDRAAAQRLRPSLRHTPVTLIALAAILGAFVVEYFNGALDDFVAVARLGALWTEAVTERGEYWRLASSALLHAGFLHIFSNALMLLVFGVLVERPFGSLRMGVILLCGAVFSAFCVLIAMARGWTADGIYLGASGAIYALVGAEIARQWRRYRAGGSARDKRTLMLLGGLVAFQVFSDQWVAEASGMAHMSGLAVGIALGALLAPKEADKAS